MYKRQSLNIELEEAIRADEDNKVYEILESKQYNPLSKNEQLEMLKRCILNDNLYLFDLCKRYFHTNDQWWEGQQDDLVETIFWYDAINMYKAFVNRRLIPAKGNLSKAIERKSKAITIYLLNSTDEKVIYNIFAELDKQKKEKEIKFLADLLMKIGAENNNENFLDIAMTYDADLEKLKDNNCLLYTSPSPRD